METPFVHRKLLAEFADICPPKNLAAESVTESLSAASFGSYFPDQPGGNFLKYMENGKQSIQDSDAGVRRGFGKKFLKSLQKELINATTE